jgi:hypothetical protein
VAQVDETRQAVAVVVALAASQAQVVPGRQPIRKPTDRTVWVVVALVADRIVATTMVVAAVVPGACLPKDQAA